ncbi:MAG: AAA family ATPase [Candidatus Micrarchaeia archaeon]
MDIVFIYGPPGVGKLTVAKELEKITGYKLLHNHLAIDLVSSIFDRNNKYFYKLIDKERVILLKYAAKSKIKGVIITSVNIKGKDDKFVKDIINISKGSSGRDIFVRLSCDLDIIRDRLSDNSRKRFGKLTDVDIFNDFISKNTVTHEIDFVNSFTIKNDNISPKNAAEMIKTQYLL